MTAPNPDGRRRPDLLEHATEIAPYYTGEWDPEADDAGAALLQLFAGLAEEVTERVDRVPEKHRVAFYDRLGFSRQPPQAARLPLAVTVADGVDENVTIPSGTQAIGGTPEQTFQVLSGDGFEATPAQLTAAYSVSPAANQIYEHDALPGTGRATLFRGDDGKQEHVLHIGHTGQLAVDGTEDPVDLMVTVKTGTPGTDLARRLDWEFYGERDGETDWHPIETPSAPGSDDGGSTGGSRPYEALVGEVVSTVARVVRRLEEELDQAMIETVVESATRAVRLIHDELGEEDVETALTALSDALEALAGGLAEGPAAETIQGKLAEAVEELADDLGTGPFATAIEEDLAPALQEMVAAYTDGPFEEAYRTELLPALRSFSESVTADGAHEPLVEALEALATRLRTGETTGEAVSAVSDLEVAGPETGGQGRAIRSDVPPDATLNTVLRALVSTLEALRAELVGSALGAVVEALVTVLEDLDAQLASGDLDEPLTALDDAVSALRDAVDVAAVDQALRRLVETLSAQLEELEDGPVGETVRDELVPAVEALVEKLRADADVTEVAEGLLAVWALLLTGPVGDRLRGDGADALERLADTLGDTPVAEESEPLRHGLVAIADALRSGRVQPAALQKLVRAYLEGVPGGAEDEGPVATRRLTLEIDGKVTEKTVNGIESRWLRCRLPADEWDSELFGIRIGGDSRTGEYSPPVGVGPVRTDEIPTEKILANETEVTLDDDGIFPLGQTPRQQNAFYIASEEAFTKAAVPIELSFENDPPTSVGFDIDPDLAWEYWDGEAWSKLPLETTESEVENLVTKTGTLTFKVPPDLEATSVAGHDGHWIRARLAEGAYGRFESREASTDETSSNNPDNQQQTETDSWVTEHEVQPPRLLGLSLGYSRSGQVKPAGHLVRLNNLSYDPDLVAAEQSRFQPFIGLPDSEQALYLGFDRPLDNGPINLLIDFVETQYETSFHPRVRWERLTAAGQWTAVQVRDGTEGLTERGVVGLSFAEPTRSSARFGTDRHWLRARVTGSPFEQESETAVSEESAGQGTDGLEPCDRRVRTRPPAGIPGRDHPTVSGLYRNVGWTHNVQTVEDELLGSSDGTQDQTVTVSRPPAMRVDLWVDELRVLSADQRQALEAADDEQVRAEPGPDGEPAAFWVRWTPVDSFLNSDGGDRHYTLDAASGEIRFGDGNRGRIPPRGRDNFRASYRTGGGAAGNVPADAIGKLKSAIPFVDAVTNPIPADGGADAESVAGVVDRAPKELRDRGRAVTEADVERVALDVSRQLARVRCLPAMDRWGEYAPGWVTLLIVPQSSADKPTPSVTLREQVRRGVSQRAAATLVGDPEQLVVRGPSYVTVSVEADLSTTGIGSLSRIEERAGKAVTDFLHPLTGGPSGDGWGFGDPPCHSDLYTLLEGLEGIDHVEELVLRFRGTDSTVNVRDGDTTPSMSADTLVHSGTHELRASPAIRTGGQ